MGIFYFLMLCYLFLGIAIVFEYNNLVDLVDGSDSGDLTYKICSQGAGLRDLEYGVREAD